MKNLNLRMANQERIVTIGWLVAFGIMVLALNGCRNDSVSETEVDGSLGAGQTSVTLHVLNMAEEQGMFWDGWPNRVEEALAGLPGVVQVEVEFEKDWIDVIFVSDRVSMDDLIQVVNDEGFEATVVQR